MEQCVLELKHHLTLYAESRSDASAATARREERR